MQKFFKAHPEFVLISSAVIFLAIVLTYFFWGMTTLISAFNKALNSGRGEGALVGFNIKGAEGLDLKGLVR